MAFQSSFSDTFSEVNQAPTIQPAQGGLFDRAVLLSLTISSLGTKRKVQSAAVEVEADKDYIHVSKDLLKSDLLEQIKKFDGATRAWINERSLPSLFRNGVYLWPMALVIDADNFLISRMDQRQPLIDRLCDAYQALKAEAQSRLGVLFNPTEYPDVQKVRESYSMSYQFIECNTPGRLNEISTVLFERERQKAESVWRDALTEAKDMLRGQLVVLVDHMRDRLSVGSDGKPKKFKNSLVSNMSDFLTLFDARNIADDNELSAIVQRCREVLGTATSEAIRDSDTMRARIAAGFEGIASDLSGLVQDAGRSINLESSNDDNWGDI